MACWRRLCSVSCLLLAACAGADESPTAAEPVEQALPEGSEIAAAFGPRTSWSEVIAADGAVEDAWLKTFDDPELEKIVAEALRNNRRLAVAGANLETAGQLAAQAGQALEAAVAVAAIADDDATGEPGPSSFGAALNLQWEIDVWERLRAAAAAAGDAFSAPVFELAAARQSLAAQTAKAWFLASETNLQLALSRQAVEIRELALQSVRSSVDSGDIAAAEIALAEAELAAAGERQRRAIGALIQALRSFEAILGRYPSAELAEVREAVPAAPAVPAGIPAALLERRVDLVAAERRVAAAFQRLQAARVAGLPRLPLTTAGGIASSELLALLAGSGNFFSRGASFLAPPAGDGETGSEAKIETAQQQAALQNYGALARRALEEVIKGLDNEVRLTRRAALLANALDEPGGVLAGANTGYDDASNASPSTLRLRTRALDARIRLVRIRYARLAQRVDLHLALGGGFGR